MPTSCGRADPIPADYTACRGHLSEADTHLNEFFDDVHIGLLEHALLNGTKALRPSGRAHDGIAGSGRGQKQILTDTVQAAGVGKERQLNAAHLLRNLLARLRDTDCAIRANADRTRPPTGW